MNMQHVDECLSVVDNDQSKVIHHSCSCCCSLSCYLSLCGQILSDTQQLAGIISAGTQQHLPSTAPGTSLMVPGSLEHGDQRLGPGHCSLEQLWWVTPGAGVAPWLIVDNVNCYYLSMNNWCLHNFQHCSALVINQLWVTETHKTPS